MFKDILLTLPSYPKTASRATLRKAVDLARLLEAHLTCLVNEPTIPLPVAFHPYSAELEKQLNARQYEVHETAVAELGAFEEEARLAGLSREARIVASPDGNEPDPIVEFARLRDLTVVPFIEKSATCSELVEALVFQSGRPVLVLPQDGSATFALNNVAVAWDASRAAARAAGDALPLLRRAKEVRVVTIAKDKRLPENATGPEFAAHLARNGVKVKFEEVERGRRSVGQALEAATGDADLVVMGAFGHSRLRDFFLGGATLHVLEKPQRPTLLSH